MPERLMGPSYPEIQGVQIPMVALVESPKNIQSELGQQPFVLPDEFKPLLERKINEFQRSGSRAANGESLSLDSFGAFPDRLRLHFRPSRYFDFLATHLSLDDELPSGQTLRKTYADLELMLTQSGYANSPYSKMIGVSSVILTADKKVIIQRRSARTAVAPSVLHVAIAEGMSKIDKDKNGNISPKATVLRGLRQELFSSNLSISQLNIDEEDIEILALGISRQYLQPDFSILVRVPYLSAQLQDMAQRARGRWERNELFATDFNEGNISYLIKKNDWSVHGSFALAMALRAVKQ